MEQVEHRKIPNSLRKFRRHMNYSQKDVAKILGLKSTSRISRWESGISMPSLENSMKMSILYSRLTEDLFSDLSETLRRELKEKQHA